METIMQSKKRQIGNHTAADSNVEQRPLKQSKAEESSVAQLNGYAVHEDGPRLSAAQRTLRVYELVENILRHLPREDLLTCVQVDSHFRSVAQRSETIQHRIFGDVPPNHNLIWKIKTLTNYPGPRHMLQVMRTNMRFHPMWTRRMSEPYSTFYTIPVALNFRVFAQFDHGWRRSVESPRPGTLLRRSNRNRVLTQEEHWACIQDTSRPLLKVLRPVIDWSQLSSDSLMLDMFLTEPAITRIRIKVITPPGQGREIIWSFHCTRKEGIRVRDVIDEIAKSGPIWVKQLRPSATTIYVLDEMVSVVAKDVYDYVQDLGIVYQKL